MKQAPKTGGSKEVQHRVRVHMAGGMKEEILPAKAWETKRPRVTARMATTPNDTGIMVGIEGRSQEGSGTQCVRNNGIQPFLTTICVSK